MNTSPGTLPVPASSDQGGPPTGDPHLWCLVRGEVGGQVLFPPEQRREDQTQAAGITHRSQHTVHPDVAMPCDLARETVPRSAGEENGVRSGGLRMGKLTARSDCLISQMLKAVWKLDRTLIQSSLSLCLSSWGETPLVRFLKQ